MVDKTGYFESLLPVIYMLLTKYRKRPPITYLSARVCPPSPFRGVKLMELSYNPPPKQSTDEFVILIMITD